MQTPSRPPNPPDGSITVKATDGSGVDPPAAGAAGAPAPTPRANDCGERSSGSSSSSREGERGGGGGGEGGGGGGAGGGEELDSPWCSTANASLGVRQPRKLHFSRRTSSGYISDSDSQPSSPLSPRPPTADKTTQTPSPAGQAMTHVLQRMAEEAHGLPPNASSTPWQTSAGDMREVEAEVGRALRQYGDEYEELLQRRSAGRHRQPGVPVNLPPHLQQEPVALLCVSLLLLLIGRLMYLRGSADSPDHSQV